MRRWILIALALLPAAATAAECRLRVAAAASLTDVLRDLEPLFEQRTGCNILFNFGASSTLVRQIERGAPADVFISADDEKIDLLEQKRLINPASRATIASNQLVIIAPPDTTLQPLASAAELRAAAISRIAIADPAAVPAGVYTRRYLESQKLWNLLEPKIVPTANVRTALAAAVAGEVDAAFVYATDARTAADVRVIFKIPTSDTPAIRYIVAVISDSENESVAARFVSYIRSPYARRLFRSHGFAQVSHDRE